MASVGIHPPKTPVTKGSMGIASATLPNVCKMPGPPAPFVPSPLPNIAKSGSSPKGYSKKVKIEGKTVAIRGATFKSMGDMASKGTGGGLISANTHGPAKFITPGSLTVKIEGKSVHLLGEPMLNNCGPSGSPPNTGATMTGVKQVSAMVSGVIVLECKSDWTPCQKKQMQAKAAKMDAEAKARGGLSTRSTAGRIRKAADSWAAKFARDWKKSNPTGWPQFSDPSSQDTHFYDDCAKTDDPLGNDMQADHMVEVQLGGHVKGPFLWLDAAVNGASGRQIRSARSRGITNPSGFTTQNC